MRSMRFSVNDMKNIVFFIGKDGCDENIGSFEEPLQTLAEAKRRIKDLPRSGENVTAFMRGGRYYLDETLVFDETDRPNVTFCAYKDELCEIAGTKPVKGFEKETVNGKLMFTKTLGAEFADFHSLFKGDVRLSTPRFPKKGYLRVHSLNTDDNIWDEKTTPWPLTLGQHSFNASPGDISAPFHNIADVTVRVLHYWHDELSALKAFDPETGRVSFERPATMLIKENDKYYFENVFEALSEPGEWYFDKVCRKLYYVPFEGDDENTLILHASSLEQLVKIDGCSGLTFENLVFRDTDWRIPSEDDSSNWGSWRQQHNMDAPQAALDVKGVFSVRHASGILIKNCEFINMGASAVKFMKGTVKSAVENCRFENIAGTAVFAGGVNSEDKTDPDVVSDITIKNNEIYKYGRRFFCAIGVHLTFVNGADICNNEIHDGYYTAISVGWIWGYAYHITNNISIKNNLIYNIGQGWLSDMGGVYMLGEQPGSVVSGNVIHNVAADPDEGGYGGWGLYLDEGSQHIILENNLVFCCGSQGFHTHYGRGNTVRNNILALNGEGAIRPVSRPEGHIATNYIGNILLTAEKTPVYNVMNDKTCFKDDGNLIFNITEPDALYFCKGDFSGTLDYANAKAEGFAGEDHIADPCFADLKGFDFILNENSPAFDHGFKAFDYTLAGTLPETLIGIITPGGKTAYNFDARLCEFKGAK